MLRRCATLGVAAILLASSAVGVAGCGSSSTGQLKVTISGEATKYSAKDQSTWARYKPGDQATFTVTVVNTGPGSVTGVSIHVTLPAGFHYRSTERILAPGATRTQPIEAAVNTSAPIFGLWTLSPPGAAGPTVATEVAVSFIANVDGQPGAAAVRAFANGDASVGQSDGVPYNVSVDAAAKLAALVTVNPTGAAPGGAVQYEVRITNSGTGNAANVGVLVTLPGVMSYTSSVTPFAGNGSRDRGVDPIRNTLEVFYNGFTLPPISNGSPGFVVIVFTARVAAAAAAGTYTVDCNVTDDAGDTFSLQAVAPVAVT